MDYRRIELAVKPGTDDPYAHHILRELRSFAGSKIKNLRIIRVYTVYSDLQTELLREFALEVLCDPVLYFFELDLPAAARFSEFSWAFEVSFKRGVTDNVGKTATEVLKMFLESRNIPFDERYRIFYSNQYLLEGDFTENEVLNLAREAIYNPLIEEVEVLDYRRFKLHGGFKPKQMVYVSDHTPSVRVIELDVSDKELKRISEQRVLALTVDEMKYFRAYFEREDVQEERRKIGLGKWPTDAEIECFAQTQSEHCKHKIFNADIIYRENGKEQKISSLFKTYIQGATEKLSEKKKWLVSVFKDNAGVISFDENYNLAFKVETHNSPSALDPYGGAITGIVGCDRDPAGTGIGARIIAHTDVLCFGDPYYRGELPPRMMHPRRIMEGVVKGIEDGGNKCGIPTINGAIIFDDSFRGKPLVFCGSVGIMPKKIGGVFTHEKKILPGDVIVMVGGRIGKDGIHGATFSSEEIKETSPTQAVQIGDPITQKKMFDMLEEAREKLLFRAITDNGAGGLSSSVGEMALLSGGAYLELSKAPLKYPGLDPWEILLSEAQERMTLAVPREALGELLKLAAKRDVLAVPMGEFTDSGYFHVCYEGKTVLYLRLSFLHSRIPFQLEAEWEPRVFPEEKPEHREKLDQILYDMVCDLNACSREPVILRYDHEVGGNTVIKPLIGRKECGPSNGGVIAPVPGSRRGFALGAGINPFYSMIDTYLMALNVVDEAIRNVVACGADPDYVALLDNFCWPDPVYNEKTNPDGRYKLAQLVRAARGLYDAALGYGAPFISGKDSMKNDYMVGGHKVSVLPTILVSAIGIVPDVTKCVTPDFKIGGDIIYLIGETQRHLGCSLYYRKYGGRSSVIPTVDPDKNMKTYRACFKAINEGLLESCHDLSEGGLGIAFAESCIGGQICASIDLSLLIERGELSPQEILFSESSGRFLVTVRAENEEKFKNIFKGVRIQRIGKVGEGSRIVIKDGGREIAIMDLDELTRGYRKPLYDVLQMEFG